MTSKPPTPKRGEIWWVNLDPTIGAEIRKQRPSVVISSDAMGVLPIKLIAPLTGWDARYAGNLWHVKIDPDKGNGLHKVSAVDVLQVRGVDTRRFVRKIGKVSASTMSEIAAALAAVVEYL